MVMCRGTLEPPAPPAVWTEDPVPPTALVSNPRTREVIDVRALLV